MVIVCHSFDKLLSPHVRWLHEASKYGEVCVLLLSDNAIETLNGHKPLYPYAEREYLVHAFRFTSTIKRIDDISLPALVTTLTTLRPKYVVDHPYLRIPFLQEACKISKIPYLLLSQEQLQGFPPLTPLPPDRNKPKVVVTGCYDWLHSGHIRFFEEASSYGNLYVCVGNDSNVRHLKGPSHPMFPQEERRYMVGAVRFVCEAFISSGQGWLDAQAEIERIKPDIYVVNEDGDRPEKREFCKINGIQYLVLRRKPKAGLPPRTSTTLRGF